MLAVRLLVATLLALALPFAASAQVGVQMYNGSWIADSFGNDNIGGTQESQYFEILGMPQGILCNPGQPRCPFSSTPVSTPGGMFSALGTICTPISAFGTPTRPAKGATKTSGGQATSKAVRYRNTFFFSSASGMPKMTSCTDDTTVGKAKATVFLSPNDAKRGVAMKGKPLTGSGTANVTSSLGFSFSAAPATPTGGASGFRRTTLGSFNNYFPYLYSYTYATLRNASGVFGPNQGPGNFTVFHKQGKNTVAQAKVQQGANKFGGVMRLLGQLTVKVCYFRNGGCSLGENNWRYEAIGTSAYTSGGVVTQGYLALYTAKYYHTKLMQNSSVMVVGSRFPWTTGTVTLTATGRGPHKTIEVRNGYDNRNTTGSQIGQGTIQLVSPILTRWNQPATNFETGGVGILRLQFVPEPGQWAMLVAGLSLLGVVYRARGR